MAGRRSRAIPPHPWRRRWSRRRPVRPVRRHSGLSPPAAGNGPSRSARSPALAPAHPAARSARDCAGSARAHRRHSRRRSAPRARRARRAPPPCLPRRCAHARAASARPRHAPCPAARHRRQSGPARSAAENLPSAAPAARSRCRSPLPAFSPPKAAHHSDNPGLPGSRLAAIVRLRWSWTRRNGRQYRARCGDGLQGELLAPASYCRPSRSIGLAEAVFRPVINGS